MGFTRVLMALPLLVLLAACSQSSDPASQEARYEVGDVIREGGRSTEEMVLLYDTIVRADLLGMTTSTLAMTLAMSDENDSGWAAALEFRFRVHEYLKGSGPNEVVGIVTDEGWHATEAVARAQLERLASGHDTRWDGRQAIIFLGDWHVLPTLSAQDRFLLGMISTDGADTYSLKTGGGKGWLPAAARSGSASRTRGPQDPLFLLDVPSSAGIRGGSTTATEADRAPTISLSAMKKLIVYLEAEASAGGTDDHRKCVEMAYAERRRLEYLEDDQRRVTVVYRGYRASGEPAGQVLWENTSGAPTQDNAGRQWFEGKDAGIVRYEPVDFGPSPYPNFLWYTQRVVTARPLPAGSYQVYHNYRGWFQEICNKMFDIERNTKSLLLTVTAPDRTLHEAFFDPVEIGAAVGADDTNGVLKPATFSVDGTPTTITSLKWEDGEVTVGLSPSASLADYTLDFIDITGTTTLSLSSDNASTTALTWTVPVQPWADSDLLMLRIHRPLPPVGADGGLRLVPGTAALRGRYLSRSRRRTNVRRPAPEAAPSSVRLPVSS